MSLTRPIESHTMNKAAEKLYAAMSANPTNWRLLELKTIAKRHRLEWHMDGSHCVFKQDDGQLLSVPSHGVIKVHYVKEFVLFVKGV
ncbi:hypothetical protein GTP46_03020 [Duganella sp. FT135W]|uniref:Type II toxin-antitoxin system HicA family toxin n=1 Tax=Duganella flavida TaxID=2692175 RepID=A0A6L8K288_9BURK|nr:hypothetical protein [Duganella flavida]MYM21619.1 hypothetical protein [Duganella flavida]